MNAAKHETQVLNLLALRQVELWLVSTPIYRPCHNDDLEKKLRVPVIEDTSLRPL
jgi:hypothetical protein